VTIAQKPFVDPELLQHGWPRDGGVNRLGV
jgi:hypothetical protein